MLIKILAIAAVLIIVLIVVIIMQPDTFRVSRSITIAAPAATIFSHINTVKNWQAWSPWVKMDPQAQYGFAGPDSGVGAITRWTGTKSGQGSSTITDSKPNELIIFRLDFIKPMPGTNTTEFLFKPDGDNTIVTWTMFGPANFIAKAMGLIMNCEKMVGGQFEQGLADLKRIVEAKA